MNLVQKSQVIVVDDDLEVQKRILEYFSDKNYAITFFCDGESALKECKINGMAWDVLLSDLHLSERSCPDFSERIQKKRPDLPVIYFTLPHATDTAAEMIRKGAYDFIVKPLHLSQLLVSVERALQLKTLKGDLSELRERVKASQLNSNGIIGKSPKFLAALEVARRVSSSQANIFISGESGTGKEVFAHYIHNEGKRSKGPFVAINCSAIPENLLESELFGHAKGSFTGAFEKKIGLFEEAENGTLFLDEIGDLSLNLQAKLLRVLQEKQIKRVGENQYRKINARIISATHKNLADEIQAGSFREDLFYRLSVIPIVIPSLRDRVDDILPLAESFLKRFALENGSMARRFSIEAKRYLIENHWRGNVRELENAVERAVVLSSFSEIQASNFMDSIIGKNIMEPSENEENSKQKFVLPIEGRLPSLEEAIQKYIEFAVDYNDGARDRTAREIGIDRKTLYKRLKVEDPATRREVSTH